MEPGGAAGSGGSRPRRNAGSRERGTRSEKPGNREQGAGYRRQLLLRTGGSIPSAAPLAPPGPAELRVRAGAPALGVRLPALPGSAFFVCFIFFFYFSPNFFLSFYNFSPFILLFSFPFIFSPLFYFSLV